ncbi:hypothetical protein [Tepidimonas ignava]|uniref:hypothetical protein n=1 Tax=Tepidimonas ignava TaxID=114249 RepID=UPI001047265E|nr:hypothetical protein [Tepidimonas ignava]
MKQHFVAKPKRTINKTDRRRSHSSNYFSITAQDYLQYTIKKLKYTVTDIMIFIHDDAWIDGHFIVDRASAGLETFDIVGVAGNRRRTPFQPSRAFIFDAAINSLRWDEQQHLRRNSSWRSPFGRLSRYGPTG